MMAVIWTGMVFFFGDMGAVGKYVFYLVSSWLLFLIVIILKTLFKSKKSE
ncbi:heme exporter protein D [Virgibacillus halotolerans]|nr:heme exporter protein D [Virgibacillus halotolerans]